MCECTKDAQIEDLETRVSELEGEVDDAECDYIFWKEKSEGLQEDLGRYKQAMENIVKTCTQCPETASFASGVLDGSAFVSTYPDKYNGEKVLVFSRGILGENFWKVTAASPGAASYLNLIFEKGECQFMTRAQAEINPQFKQLIPYVVCTCRDRVFSYVRGKKSGEERLIGNRSIGIGGHINPIDETDTSSWPNVFLKGARREVKEEVHFNKNYALIPEAVLNEANEVGQVHFGVLFVVEIESESDISAKEDHLTDGGFIKISELKTGRKVELEGWSKLAIDLL